MNQEIKQASSRFREKYLEFTKAENSLDLEVYVYITKNKLNINQLRSLADQLPMNSLARKNVYQKIYKLQS